MSNRQEHPSIPSRKKVALAALPWLLPVLAGAFPSLFHYGNNARLLFLPSLVRMLALNVGIALLVFFLFLLLKRRPLQAANASFVFLIFYNTYGILYLWLWDLDFVQVEHYTLLPLYLFLAGYASWLAARIGDAGSKNLWNGVVSVLAFLIIFNLVKIVPAEINKAADSPNPIQVPVTREVSSQNDPDIYFIIFDEMSGFEPMRKYWHNTDVDDFKAFLDQRGFFIAENSHGSSLTTLHLLSERLNYREYPCCVDEYTETYFRAISDNRVMRYLKARGYTTVVFDETPYLYPTKTQVLADYSFVYGQDAGAGSTFMLDEFGLLVIDNSMLRAFSQFYISTSPAEIAHQKMILSTVDRIGNLDDISTPRFVFVHLMIPHTPFMFDEDGTLIPAAYHQNWNYYLGNYKYAIKVAMQLVDNILAASDPERPPVIILQSDHGARNSDKPRAVNLENFPEEYKTNIFFALNIPGYDTTQIPQDVNPINTFPIVFNYLFGDEIPLIK